MPKPYIEYAPQLLRAPSWTRIAARAWRARAQHKGLPRAFRQSDQRPSANTTREPAPPSRRRRRPTPDAKTDTTAPPKSSASATSERPEMNRELARGDRAIAIDTSRCIWHITQ